jgi:RNA polymerase sigma-70 factor, ECF subfamily
MGLGYNAALNPPIRASVVRPGVNVQGLEGHRLRVPGPPSPTPRRRHAHATAPLLSTSQPAPASDEALVSRVLAGETSAFEELVNRYERAIVNFIYRMIGDYEQALDLAQEVFFKVYRSLGRFDPTFRFSTWLYRIASNRSIDHLRKRNPALFSLDDPGDASRTDRLVQLRSSTRGPDELLASAELGRQIDQAIQALPPGYRELVLLRHLQGMPYAAIAQMKRLPLGTVKNRLFRAREILRKRMGR